MRRLLSLIAGLLALAAWPGYSQVEPFIQIITADGVPNLTVVTPVESDAVLANPGMGFTTQSSLDQEVPGYPKSTIAYYRWYWDELEPKEGQFNWAMVDSVLAAARARGQRLATRIMPANGKPRVPDWYRKTGARGWDFVAESTQNAGKTDPSWMPDHEDPLFAKYMGRLVREFAKRYDGHPDIDHIDIGSYGHWGEWHLSFVREKQTYGFDLKKMIIDWYLEGFKKTPMVIPEDAEEGLIYATQHGVGWRADCMGDYGPPNNWNLMTRYLELPRVYPSVGEAWKKSPVAFESCGTMESWLAAGRDIEFIYSTCLELHTSIYNNKSSAIPPEWWPATERFLKRMGYRFVVRSFRHEKWLQPGGMLNLEMTLDNIGVAPPYRAYIPVFEIRKAGRNQNGPVVRKETEWAVREWLPGRHVQSAQMPLAESLPPGRYLVYFALLDPFTKTPAVQLAVDGLDAQGWYSWTSFEVVEKGAQ
ncbi:MAG TPA: DUF4832 domain-containing protein [bacterium]|nr:DUF4832 domain-containing protein [bacterium]